MPKRLDLHPDSLRYEGLVGLLSVLAVLCLSCGRNYTELPGRPPVERIRLVGHSISLELGAGIGLRSVFELPSFGGITPSMGVDAAAGLLRQSPQRRTYLNSPAFYFRASQGEIALVKRMVDSEGDSVEKWELYAFPRDPRPQRLVSPEILAQIPDIARTNDIQVVTADGSDSVHVSLTEGDVEWIYWGQSLESDTQASSGKATSLY